MDTLITKVRGTIGGTDSPVMTYDGKILDYYVGMYYNLLKEKMDYTPEDYELAAIVSFVDDGRKKGWINYIKFFLPFIGDTTHGGAGKLPLIDNVLGYELTVTTAGSQFLYDSNNKLIAFKNSSSYVLEYPIPPSVMRGGVSFIATGIFTNVNSGLVGYRWTGGQCSFRTTKTTSYDYPDWFYSDAPDNTGTKLGLPITNLVAGTESCVGLSLWTDETLNSGEVFTNKIYIPKDSSVRNTALKAKRTTSLSLPSDTRTPITIGLYTTYGYPNQKVKSFALTDPEMPIKMVEDYCAAVFTLNTALGKDEQQN